MARLARQKSNEAAFYHLFNRVAGDPTDYPFRRRRNARRFFSFFEFYLRLYFCRMASFELMGNHYHCVIQFEAVRKLSREELQQRARMRFGRHWQLKTQNWSRSRWKRFNRELFDVSCFMHHVNGEFAKWFNRREGRRGPFWADRFKNPQLLDEQALQNAILYTELNAVRAGLVKRPESYRWGSAYWRWARKKTDLLIPLEELFPADGQMDSYQIYRALLYHRGAVATKEGQAVIPASIKRREQEWGFAQEGILRQRLRFITDGIAIGGQQPVRALLKMYREEGRYLRRKNPIPQLGGLLFSLREQRSHAFSPG
jgi:REP element-mobilizing transposase RayT